MTHQAGPSSAAQNKKLIFLILIGCGVLAASYHYWSLKFGPGVSPDSTIYLEAAKNIRSGNGLYVEGSAITHYPPVFPGIIALISYFTAGDVFAAGHIICAICLGMNLILFCTIALLSTKWNLIAGASSFLIFISSPLVLFTHAMLWSETIFIVFTLLTILLLMLYVHQSKLSFLVLTAVAASLALLTRYAGAALLPSIILFLLITKSRSNRDKGKEVAIFITTAILPFSAWMIRNVVLTGSLTNRSLVFHPITNDHLQRLLSSVFYYLVPTSEAVRFKGAVIGGTILIYLASFLYLFHKKHSKRYPTDFTTTLMIINLSYLFFYPIFIIGTISFFDAQTPLSPRILLPILLTFPLAFISQVWLISQEKDQKHIWNLMIFFILLLSFIKSFPLSSLVQVISESGLGYSSQAWLESETITSVKEIPEELIIYSNGPDAIRFLTDKTALSIPEETIPSTKMENQHYHTQLHQMSSEVTNGYAVVVVFDRINWRWYLPTKKDLATVGKIPILKETDDGVIFGIAE